MSHRRKLLIAILIFALIANGCQPSLKTVCEYSPGKPTTQRSVQRDAVISLWKTDPATPTDKKPVFVTEILVPAGARVGFTRCDGKLIGMAGPTTMPLKEAQYEWKRKRESVAQSNARAGFFETAAYITIVIALVPLIIVADIFLNRDDDGDCSTDSGAGPRHEHKSTQQKGAVSNNPPADRKPVN